MTSDSGARPVLQAVAATWHEAGGGRRPSWSLTLDFVLRRLEAARRLFDDDLIATLVFVTITHGNVAHLDRDESLYSRWSGLALPPPDSLRRPISGYAAAQALGLPRETVRRKIAVLMARGQLMAGEGGYYTPASAHADPAMVDLARTTFVAARDYFLRMSDLGLVSAELTAAAEREPQRPRMVARAVNDFGPTLLEPLQRLGGGDLTNGIVFGSIAVFNLSGRAGAGRAGDGDSEARPPMRPISALALSARVGIARETTRRHVRRLVAMDLAADGPGGLTVPWTVLATPRVQATLERACAGQPALLQRLALAGILSSHTAPGG